MPTSEQPAVIRPATEADLDAIVEVTWQVAAEGRWLGVQVPFDRDERRGRVAGLLGRADATVFVAVVGDAVLGYLNVEVASYGVGDIGMAILDGWRGRRIGTGLLDAAIAWAPGAGAHKLWLEVWPDNEAAIALYRRAGFVEEGRKRRHYRRADGVLRDAVLMGRPLGDSSTGTGRPVI